MARIDRILQESEEQAIRFIDPKSAKGRRILTLQGANIHTGNEHLLAVEHNKLVCTIEKAPGGWDARFGLQELSDVHPTLDSCKEMIVRRSKISHK